MKTRTKKSLRALRRHDADAGAVDVDLRDVGHLCLLYATGRNRVVDPHQRFTLPVWSG